MKGDNEMFNLTKRSMDHFLNFFKPKKDKDEDIKDSARPSIRRIGTLLI